MRKIKLLTTTIVLGTALFVLAGCGAAQTTATPAPAADGGAITVSEGLGNSSVFRVRTKDGKNIYQFNYVTASALFDKDGKILNVTFDIQEVGEEEFSGWPENDADIEKAKQQLAAWESKRQMGDEKYGMPWSAMVDHYQEFFKGKTVAEVEEWVKKNTNDKNGKPLNPSNEADKEKYAQLSEDEKAVLADVTSGATISLTDAHGDFIAALVDAYERKVEVTLK